jgi:hypothetical protein
MGFSFLFFEIKKEVFMSTNFGIGSRDLASAGRLFLKQGFVNKGIGTGSLGKLSKRWNHFADFARAHQVKKLENVTRELVMEYGNTLRTQVLTGKISAGHAHDKVSAVNSVLSRTPARWRSVGAVRDCQMPPRINIRTEIPGGFYAEPYQKAIEQLQAEGNDKGVAIAQLARHLGLRAMETSLLNAKKALQEAERTASVTITAGTKSGRDRVLPITHPDQIRALRHAAEVQGRQRNLIPADQTWGKWERGPLRIIRNTIKANTGHGIHDLRAAYACHRYRALTGQDVPLVAGRLMVSKAIDRAARLQVSADLGHGRIGVTVSYIGARS